MRAKTKAKYVSCPASTFNVYACMYVRYSRYAYLLFDKDCKGIISRQEVTAVVAENGQKDAGSMGILSQVYTPEIKGCRAAETRSMV